MSPLPAGPYRILTLADGTKFPYYIIPFDENGRCVGPETRKHLLANAKDYTDVYLFSHGWNNDWAVATARYESFINGFTEMRVKEKLSPPQGYKPLLVGVFWPSAVLVAKDETAPKMASANPAMDTEAGEENEMMREIAKQLPAEKVDRFYDLVQREELTHGDALELAKIIQPIYASSGDDEMPGEMPGAEDLVKSWVSASPKAVADDEFDDVGIAKGNAGADPQAAGIFDKIRNLGRDAIRLTTVWMMKDRAGRVGANGVAPLLVDLMSNSAGRFHLIGHSYGAKVVLSALCKPPQLPRPAHSLLLLQPAVSHLCFADAVPGTDPKVPGGYRAALNRVERPIFTTFSKHDVPLTRVFHLAVRRASDLGEVKIAAAGEPPSVYAALGGFGPRKAGEKLIDMPPPPNAYPGAADGVRIYGLRSDATINGHGDVSNAATWWALYNAMGA